MWIKSPCSYIRPVDNNEEVKQLAPFIYIGRDRDAGKFIYWNEFVEKYVIEEFFALTPQVGATLTINDTPMSLGGHVINSKRYYEGLDWQLYYTTSEFGWVLLKGSTFCGYIPEEYKDELTNEWAGDAFYTVNGDPTIYTAEGYSITLTPRGRLKNGSSATPTVGIRWQHWECDTLCGTYEPKNGAQGNINVGFATWERQISTRETESVVQLSDSEFTGGWEKTSRRPYKLRKYETGGYYEASMPVIGKGFSASWVGNEPEDVRDNLDYTWAGYTDRATKSEYVYVTELLRAMQVFFL